MDKKKFPVFHTISILYFIWLILYYLGCLVCGATGLEYRMWVWLLGNFSLFAGLPVWLFLLWYRWRRRREKSETLRRVITLGAAVLFVLWSYLLFWYMVFAVQEEHRLFHDYMVVNRGAPLSETEYELCRRKAFFFREDADWDTDFEIEYLEDKYGRDFLEAPFDEEKMLFYDKRNTAAYYGKTVPVPAEHADLPVQVHLAGGKPEDDYIRLLTAWYVKQGCEELGIDRPLLTDESGNLHLCFSGEEDIKAAAADAQKLIDYAARDVIFRDYRSTVRFSLPSDFDETIYIPFGKMSTWDDLEEGYYRDSALLEEMIRKRYEEILESRKERETGTGGNMDGTMPGTDGNTGGAASGTGGNGDEAALGTGGNTGGTAAGTGGNSAGAVPGIGENTGGTETGQEEESVYAQEARRIFEEILLPTGTGEKFSADYNARGEEYYPLGEDGTYQYTLFYDRDSRNGDCRLYVLYRCPYDTENGRYYYYTDTMAQIADIYAVKKETGEIIASGRTAWADLGSAEYREATGE